MTKLTPSEDYALTPAATIAADLADALRDAIPEGKWSGKGPIPKIGDVVTCNDRKQTRCVITGYEVDGGWLMLLGYREADPSVKGNLAGAEIKWGAA